MYTKRIFSPATLIIWTRHELLVFVPIASVPVLIYDVLDQRWLNLPWLPIALVGTAVAFILSFQNNAAYDRSWEARKIWGGIVNQSRALAFMINDFVTDQFADEPVGDEELQRIRKRMVLRHVAWLTGLRHALRQLKPWETGHLEKSNQSWRKRIALRELNFTLQEEVEGYIPADEIPLTCGMANPPAQTLGLQSRELRHLRERGLIEDFRHMEMQNVINALLEGQGKSERIKNFPYPRQYATLNSVLLWIFILLIPFGLVHEFAAIGDQVRGDYGLVGRYFVWLTVPFSVIVMWIFHTMERIGRVTENPFEGTVNDVPISTMSRAIEIDMRQIIGDDPSEIPEPIQAVHDTQT